MLFDSLCGSAQKFLSLLLAALVAGLGSGCESVKQCSLTYKLWDNGVRSYCEPVADPELALFEAPSKPDILVQYTAISDRHDGVRRLAYFLEANQRRIVAGRAPHFVNPKRCLNLQPIPKGASNNCYFIAGGNGQTFTLYRQGREPQCFNLPDYRDDHNAATRAALTPLAVTGDAVLVGAVAAVIAAYALAEGNSTIR